ncbi:ATP-binding protein [Streptomyces sp. NBC_01618]|uniref:ATP-binding protein n=1 Tax=Streptomyces sp. NBC_01618 TaxID=2975900 RepID=UPI00386D4742|nr:ATP-binding protein [Streptomyces sp. NBC_01618]
MKTGCQARMYLASVSSERKSPSRSSAGDWNGKFSHQPRLLLSRASFSSLALDDLSGRGLVIVDAIAAKWGVRPRDPGKTVWVHLAIGRAELL